jgi:hypothetical protein
MAKKTVVKRANKIYFERPQVQVEGFNPLPEEEKTDDVDHEEVDIDTGEVMTAEVLQDEQPQQQAPPPQQQQQQRQQAPPPPQREQPQQQARPVNSGMDEFLNS